MTKITIIGQTEAVEPEKKKIEFVKALGSNPTKASRTPSEYANIELIAMGYEPGYDAMFAYDSERRDGCIYLGHFNDGIV